MIRISSKSRLKTKGIWRKTISSFILTIIVLNMLITSTFANPVRNDALLKQAVAQNIDLNSKGWLPSSDQVSLLYNLNKLLALSMWIDYASNMGSRLFSSAEIQVYRNMYVELVDRFNGQYGSPPTVTDTRSKYNAMKVTAFDQQGTPDGKVAKISTKQVESLIKASASYVDVLYKERLAEYNGVSGDEEKAKVVHTFDATNKACYAVLQGAGQHRDKISSLFSAPNQSGLYNPNIDPVKTVMLKTEYKPFIDRAEDLIKQKIDSATIELNTSNGDKPEMKFTTAITDGSGQQWRVNRAFQAAFACSAVYRPFVSKIGDPDFVGALDKLVGDKSVSDAYKEIAERKKPLYWSNADTKTSAKRFTINEMFEASQEDSSFMLYSVIGEFKPGKDGDYWEMQQDTGEDIIENGPNAGQNANNPQTTPPATGGGNTTTPPATGGGTTTTPPPTTGVTGNGSTGVDTKFDDDGNVVVLGDTVSDLDKLFPIYLVAENDPKGHTNMTSLVNALLTYKNYSEDDAYLTETLYLTPFGDIVTADNTVIIPAMANTFYTSDKGAYYPYTSFFMNSYPSISLDSKYFSATDNDKGKYFYAMTSGSGDADNTKVKNYFNNTTNPRPTHPNPYETVAYMVDSGWFSSSSDIDSMQYADTVMPLDTGMYNDGDAMIDMLIPKSLEFASGWQWMDSMSTAWDTMIVPNTNIVLNTKDPGTVFPYNEPNDETAYFIAKKAFEAITIDAQGQSSVSNGRTHIDGITLMFLDTCKGKKNISAFNRNIKEDFKQIIDGEMGSISKFFVGWNRTMVEKFGNTDGVVGFKTAYQDPIMGRALAFVEEYIIFFIALVMIFFIVVYAQRRVTPIRAIAGTLTTMFVTGLCLRVFPIWIPIGLNVLMGATSEDLAYRSLYTTEEKYTSSSLNYGEGKVLLKESMGLTLYKFKTEDLKETCDLLRVKPESVMGGQALVIDETSGVYLEGDCLKIDTGKLFDTLSISGEFTLTNGARNIYQLKSSKRVSNLVDYYVPYYQIVDGFIGKLNDLNTVFNIPRETIQYSDGFYKDNFMVDAYMNTAVFMTPTDLKSVADQFSPETYQAMIKVFPNNVDFLGLTEVLNTAREDSTYHDTVWYKTLVNQGYYNDKQKFIDLIEKVNLHTKKFMIDNASNFAFISDENVIKTVALYAMTTLNAEISYFGDVVYPQSVHFEDLNIEQVLIPTIVSNHDLFLTRQGGLADYVYKEFGLTGTILFMIILFLSFLIVKAMTLSIPLMYIAFLVLLLIRAFKGHNFITAMKGYSKVFTIMAVSYFIFCFATINLHRIGDSVMALLILLVVYFFVFFILCNMVLAVFTNYLDFGNTKVNASLRSIGDKIGARNPFNRANNFRADNFYNDDLNEGTEYGEYEDDYGVDTSISDNFDAEVTEHLVGRRHAKYKKRKVRTPGSTSYRPRGQDEFITDDGSSRDIFDDDFSI